MLQRIPQPLLRKYFLLTLLTPIVVPAAAHSKYVIPDSLDIRPAVLQSIRIFGKITDESSRPVANAAVLIAGSERGTVTNLSGLFEIADAPLSGTLVVKHPDFETKQVSIGKSAAEYVIRLKSRPESVAARSKSHAKASLKDSEVGWANESSNSMRVDRWPYFPGGYKGLNKFLANNLQYPHEALETGIEGSVRVSFLLDEDGNVSSGRVVSSPGEELDDEALRLVNSMPKWTPAQKDGKPIAVWYTISIQFDPELDKLPLKVKEEVPKLFSKKIKLEPWKAPVLVKDELEKLFRNRKLNLSAHEPPQTRLSGYGYGFVTPRPLYAPPPLKIRTFP
ncbi:TonB family C-terminal domain-containing protein [Dyadobacter sp. SG02]|uniref:TonB family protein n=1 Tax=Dyadobacter sp. SG02 TaxID=1855291 RepID=UPI0008AADC4F|nr:TonB family protein [Dyadobacter sp. SG02]SEJ57728.1 TonB family C-terminal domain-containing protein [Dyadobacter sp. SG02]